MPSSQGAGHHADVRRHIHCGPRAWSTSSIGRPRPHHNGGIRSWCGRTSQRCPDAQPPQPRSPRTPGPRSPARPVASRGARNRCIESSSSFHGLAYSCWRVHRHLPHCIQPLARSHYLPHCIQSPRAVAISGFDAEAGAPSPSPRVPRLVAPGNRYLDCDRARLPATLQRDRGQS